MGGQTSSLSKSLICTECYPYPVWKNGLASCHHMNVPTMEINPNMLPSPINILQKRNANLKCVGCFDLCISLNGSFLFIQTSLLTFNYIVTYPRKNPQKEFGIGEAIAYIPEPSAELNLEELTLDDSDEDYIPDGGIYINDINTEINDEPSENDDANREFNIYLDIEKSNSKNPMSNQYRWRKKKPP